MKRGYHRGEESKIEQAIIDSIAFGCTKGEASKRAGIHRTTLLRWLARKHDFAAAFALAWSAGSKRRDLRLWLRHPFRGKRPPASKRTLAFPRYGTPRLRR